MLSGDAESKFHELKRKGFLARNRGKYLQSIEYFRTAIVLEKANRDDPFRISFILYWTAEVFYRMERSVFYQIELENSF